MAGFFLLISLGKNAFANTVTWTGATSSNMATSTNFTTGKGNSSVIEFDTDYTNQPAASPTTQANGGSLWVTTGAPSGGVTINDSSASSPSSLNLSGSVTTNGDPTTAILVDSSVSLTMGATAGPFTLDITNTGNTTNNINFTTTGTGNITLDGTLTNGSSSAITVQLNAGNGTTIAIGSVTDGTAATAVMVSGTGTGVALLTGTSTNTGTTSVTGGILSVTGSTGSGNINASAGTLAGTGTYAGATALTSTANLAPGAVGSGNTATLSFSNGLTFSSGTTATFDINGTTRGTAYDSAAVTGNLNYSGLALTLNVTTDLNPGASPLTYQLFSFTTETTTTDLSSIALSGVYSGSLTSNGLGVWTGNATDSSDSVTDTLSFSDATGILTATLAVPEPRTWILLLLGSCLLLGVQSRRTCKFGV